MTTSNKALRNAVLQPTARSSTEPLENTKSLVNQAFCNIVRLLAKPCKANGYPQGDSNPCLSRERANFVAFSLVF